VSSTGSDEIDGRYWGGGEEINLKAIDMSVR